MPSTTSDNLSTIDSEQFDNLLEAVRDREAALDAELESIDSSAPGSRKRTREIQKTKLWSYARKPKDDELGKNKHYQRIWYCGQTKGSKRRPCTWSSTNGDRCRDHLRREHSITVIEEGEEPPKKQQASLGQMWQRQQLIRPEEQYNQSERLILEKVLDVEKIEEATVRLIAVRNKPLSCTTWPELIEWASCFNPYASKYIPSRQNITRALDRLYRTYKRRVMRRLRTSLSKLHFSIDVWSSPTRTNLHAIVCHFLDSKTRKPVKAILALPEHRDKHGGEEQAKAFIKVLQDFKISENKIGFFVGDNHGSNDKMLRIIKKTVKSLPKIEHIRVRCLGHVINLAVHAFLYKNDDEALEIARRRDQGENVRDADLTDEAFGGQITVGGKKSSNEVKTAEEWRCYGPIGKLFNIVKHIRSSNSLYQSFLKLTGRQIPLANATRWNSWFVMIFTALKLRKGVNSFIDDNLKALEDDRLTHAEWRQLLDFKNFL